MMMMLNYVNLFVEYVIMSVPILSHKDNYFIFTHAITYIGGGEHRYVCIYLYVGTIRVSCCHANMYSCCLVVIYVYVMSGLIYYVPNGINIISRSVVC